MLTKNKPNEVTSRVVMWPAAGQKTLIICKQNYSLYFSPFTQCATWWPILMPENAEYLQQLWGSAAAASMMSQRLWWCHLSLSALKMAGSCVCFPSDSFAFTSPRVGFRGSVTSCVVAPFASAALLTLLVQTSLRLDFICSCDLFGLLLCLWWEAACLCRVSVKNV